MALGKHRVAQVGETPYAHEKEAIDFAIQQLPNRDPFHLWVCFLEEDENHTN